MPEKTDEEIAKEVGLETTQEESLEELTIDEDLTESLEPILENETKQTKNDSIENEDNEGQRIDPIKNETKQKEEEDLPVQKKQPKIYKILIGIIGFLLLVLAIGAVLYFMGYFDPKPKEMPVKKIEVKKVEPEIEFDEKKLDKKRLNKKLTMLTKHEIMNRKELEEEEKRIKEEERKKKEAEEKALAEKKKKEEERLAAQYAKIENEKKILEDQQKAIKIEQERFLKIQEEAALTFEQKRAELLKEIENQKNIIPPKMEEPIEDEQNIEPIKEEEEPILVEKNIKEEPQIEEKMEITKSFLPFINVATIKGELYKSFLDEVTKYDKNISLCRDSKNRIEIYFGPYESAKQRAKVFDNLLNSGFKESYLIDFTNEEYLKRCKY